MGEIADDMQDIAMRWAYDSTVCENGHRYLDDGFGCPRCELELEDWQYLLPWEDEDGETP